MEEHHLEKAESIKKAYSSPKIETYGDLRSITEHTGSAPPHPDPHPPYANFRT